MKKILDELKWQPMWVSHMGCIKSGLDYLGVGISRPWLYGGTGHAFIINMYKDACPSGPTAWNTRMLFHLAPNLGYSAEGIKQWKDDSRLFAKKQKEAWDLVRASIDQGLPCYGWQMEHPDFYLIHGYDKTGYYYSGCEHSEVQGPLPWRELGTWDVTMVEVYRIEPQDPAPVDETVKSALTLAIRYAEHPEESILPGYSSGPAAYDIWAESIEAGTACRDGHAYNADVWLECREMAVDFLKEAKTKLPGRCDAEFDNALNQYAIIRDKLAVVRDLCPQRQDADWESTLQSDKIAALLREVGVEERKGLECLKGIAAGL